MAWWDIAEYRQDFKKKISIQEKKNTIYVNMKYKSSTYIKNMYIVLPYIKNI